MPRARRDPEGRKRVIVDAAIELVAEGGTGSVTHRKIAERAGVPLGSTTQHFASLDDVLDAAVTRVFEGYDVTLADLDADLERGDVARVVARYLMAFAQPDHHDDPLTGFFLATVQAPQMRDATRRWDAAQFDVLAKHAGQRFARLTTTFSYGLFVQAAQGEPLPDEDELVWMLTRFLDE